MMRRFGIQQIWRRNFANLAEVHHHYAIAHRFDNGQVMRNENHCQAEAIFHVLQQVQNLGLNTHIKRRNRLVTDQHSRVKRECASNADALALTT